MKKDLMEILACPICKNPELELLIFVENEQEIESGLIICSKCLRYYPIRKTIPIMLPDDLRKEKEDLEFLRSNQNKIPTKILTEGKPFALTKL
ncbi:MAG: Trm112 family protein [Candidatus Hodarchaeota archaeon]